MNKFAIMSVCALLATPAQALTLNELFTQLGGLQCGGSVCTLPPSSVQTITSYSAPTEITFIDGRPGFIHSLGHFVPGSLVGNEGSSASCNVVTSVESLTIGFDPGNVGDEWSLTSSVSSSSVGC